MNNTAEFYRRLGDLLEEFGVEIYYSYNDDEDKDLIAVEFASPYRRDELQFLTVRQCRRQERESGA